MPVASANSDASKATIYRMVMPDHTCPYGLKALDLLKRRGFTVEDHHLISREEVDAFKATHGVATTPQIFIDGTRIGGHDDLVRHLGGQVNDRDAVTYTPVVALFAMAAAMALAGSWASLGSLLTIRSAEWFVAIAMCLLALQKLKDIDLFATIFLNYDLLAKRWIAYGRIYPFAEATAGILMLAGALMWLSIPIALFIGSVGAVSVFKAVYNHHQVFRQRHEAERNAAVPADTRALQFSRQSDP